MKKYLSVLVAFGTFLALADDSYLYWMVGDNASDYAYNTVKVKAFDNQGGSSYLSIYAPDATSETGINSTPYESISKEYSDMGAVYAQLVSGTTYSSFVIELFNDSTFLAQSANLDYSTAVADYYIKTSNGMSSSFVAWTASSFAIPEPNSAMLILLGCAALGLRRRRQRGA